MSNSIEAGKNKTLKTVYVPEMLPALTSSIFLAGPTPREQGVPGWRDEALTILTELGYEGVVMLPEPRDGDWRRFYDDQVEWECSMRDAADIILFWVPRSMEPGPSGRASMPALTTNVEFGLDLPSGKMMYGRPNDAPSCRYLDYLWTKTTKKAPFDSLRALLEAAVQAIGQGAARQQEHAAISMGVWNHLGMKPWRQRLEAAGHRIKAVRSILAWPTPAAGRAPWLSVDSVQVEVFSENRSKNNEIVISRPDVVSVAAFYESANGLRVLLANEFRSAGGFVMGLPGGSSPDADASPLEAAVEEMWEETGLAIDANRIVSAGSRHAYPTLLSHMEHVFALELTEQEADMVEDSIRRGLVHGASDGERMRLAFPLVSDLADLDVSWGIIGMVNVAMKALNTSIAGRTT